MYSNRYQPITQAYTYENTLYAEIDTQIDILTNNGTPTTAGSLPAIQAAYQTLKNIESTLTSLSYRGAIDASNLDGDLSTYSQNAAIVVSANGDTYGVVEQDKSTPITLNYFQTNDGGSISTMDNDPNCGIVIDFGFGTMWIPLSDFQPSASNFSLGISQSAINSFNGFSL